MTWINVTMRHPVHGTGPDRLSLGLVNTDLLHAIEAFSSGSRLIWHGSSPRTEWIVTDSIDDLLTQMGET